MNRAKNRAKKDTQQMLELLRAALRHVDIGLDEAQLAAIGEESNLLELGLDSFAAAEMIGFLGDRVGAEISFEQLATTQTVGELLASVSALPAVPTDRTNELSSGA